jgi:7-carboxy-7-deazaguanine synthase
MTQNRVLTGAGQVLSKGRPVNGEHGKVDMQSTQRLRITEIFHSIQGESTYAGRRCYFVRLTGCNLRCTWCDSEYTFSGGEWMTFDEIFAKLATFPDCDLVEVTGGEPMLQAPVNDFMQQLLDRGYEVLLETGGSLDLSPVPLEVRRIVDIKPPTSGEVTKNMWANLDVMQPWDEIKAVIANRVDYEWARQQVLDRKLAERFTVLFSPAFGDVELLDLATWLLEDALPVRMQVQMHKLIWDPAARGV